MFKFTLGGRNEKPWKVINGREIVPLLLILLLSSLSLVDIS